MGPEAARAGIGCRTLTVREEAGAEGEVSETISWMARRSLSRCSGLLMPISRWISVSDKLAMMAPLLTLARQAATYHAGIPTHSWSRGREGRGVCVGGGQRGQGRRDGGDTERKGERETDGRGEWGRTDMGKFAGGETGQGTQTWERQREVPELKGKREWRDSGGERERHTETWERDPEARQ